MPLLSSLGNDSEQAAPATPAVAALSKNAQKRLAREARSEQRREQLLQKRRAVRERQKVERAQARAAATPLALTPGLGKKQSQVMLSDPRASPVRVALDLSFDHVMAEHPKDIAKLTKQIERCYGDNRRAARPLQLHITSLGTDRTASHLQARCGFSAWDVHRHEEHCFGLWPQEEIVYLCAESETVLTTLERGKTYVIGGLVDHNRCKGLTHGIARAAGLATARLPITEHVPLQCGTMLTVYHVFKILLEFEQLHVAPVERAAVCDENESGGGDMQIFGLTERARWSTAMHLVIPQRKRKCSSAISQNKPQQQDASITVNDDESLLSSNVGGVPGATCSIPLVVVVVAVAAGRWAFRHSN